MALAKKSKHGGLYCVAGGPNQLSCKNTSYTEGVSMHVFPSNPVTKRKWTSFVRRHRPGSEPKKYSALCSMYFEPSCYTQRFSFSELESKEKLISENTLDKDAVPTVDEISPSNPTELSERDRQQVSY